MTKKNLSELDRESVAFWESVERGAKEVQKLPQWMKAGLVVDPTNFVTFAPDPELAATKKRK
jgi:hypothetical protein